MYSSIQLGGRRRKHERHLVCANEFQEACWKVLSEYRRYPLRAGHRNKEARGKKTPKDSSIVPIYTKGYLCATSIELINIIELFKLSETYFGENLMLSDLLLKVRCHLRFLDGSSILEMYFSIIEVIYIWKPVMQAVKNMVGGFANLQERKNCGQLWFVAQTKNRTANPTTFILPVVFHAVNAKAKL